MSQVSLSELSAKACCVNITLLEWPPARFNLCMPDLVNHWRTAPGWFTQHDVIPYVLISAGYLPHQVTHHRNLGKFCLQSKRGSLWLWIWIYFLVCCSALNLWNIVPENNHLTLIDMQVDTRIFSCMVVETQGFVHYFHLVVVRSL